VPSRIAHRRCQRRASCLRRRGVDLRSELPSSRRPPLSPSPADMRLGEWVSYSPTRQEGHTQGQSGGGGGAGAPSPLQILSEAVEQEPDQMPAFLDGLIDKHDIDWETYR
jgi:hypothetical protein